MGRPTKQGVEYFSLDCTFDQKTGLYIMETEAIGLAILISLWQMIYSENGYYIEANDDLYLLMKKSINVDYASIDTCIKAMLKRDIFSAEKYDKHKILTSKAIQKRFFEYASRKKIVEYDPDYLIEGINVGENGFAISKCLHKPHTSGVNVDINPTKTDTSKVNDNKNATKEQEQSQLQEQEHSQLNIQEQSHKNLGAKTSKKETPLFPDKSENFNNAFQDYIEMRKQSKNKMTEKAIQLGKSKLEKLSKYEDIQIQMIEEAILNGWKSFYPLNQPKQQTPKFEKNAKFMEMEINPITGELE